MLNAYWAAVVPAIDAAGGVIEHFAGDGVMAIFNAARRPARSRRARGPGRQRRSWPRPRRSPRATRAGRCSGSAINTGPAVVGDVGAAERRSFAVIGDTTNTAARLMAAGEPGQVVVGRATWEALGADAAASRLGPSGSRASGSRSRPGGWTR